MPILKSTGLISQYRYDLPECPIGTHLATLVDLKHSYGAEMPNYDNPEVMDQKDVSVFLFAFEKDGVLHFAQTFELTQSTSDKSKLFKLLKSLKGEAPRFQDGYNYDIEIGTKCQIQVEGKISKKGTSYQFVASATPALSELHDRCPDLDKVEIPGGRQTEILDANGNPF